MKRLQTVSYIYELFIAWPGLFLNYCRRWLHWIRASI